MEVEADVETAKLGVASRQGTTQYRSTSPLHSIRTRSTYSSCMSRTSHYRRTSLHTHCLHRNLCTRHKSCTHPDLSESTAERALVYRRTTRRSRKPLRCLRRTGGRQQRIAWGSRRCGGGRAVTATTRAATATPFCFAMFLIQIACYHTRTHTQAHIAALNAARVCGWPASWCACGTGRARQITHSYLN